MIIWYYENNNPLYAYIYNKDANCILIYYQYYIFSKDIILFQVNHPYPF